MFPLGSVLVPHEILPLHVFEPRYRRLVHDCLAGDGTFGVVLIERGSEVGGGDVRFDVGCTATITVAEEQPDGRWAIVATGVQPCRVDAWLPDDPYPIAEVDLLEEGWSPEASAALGRAAGSLARVVELARELGNAVDERVLELPGEAELDQWALVSRAPIGVLDKHALLCAPGPAARLLLLEEQLGDLASVLASRLSGG